MPQIAQYEAGRVGLTPSDIGVESAQRAGIRVQASGREEGEEVGGAIKAAGNDIEQAQTRQEVSRIGAQSAQMMQSTTQGYNDYVKAAIAKDPNDTGAGQRYWETIGEPQWQQWAASAAGTPGGQRFAQSTLDSFQQHFSLHAQADQANLAANAIQHNMGTLTDSASTSVALDPTGLNQALKTVKSTVASYVANSPNLSPDAASKIQNEGVDGISRAVTKAAVHGALMGPDPANISPEDRLRRADQVMSDLKNGHFGPYVDAQEVTSAADLVSRVAKSEQAQNRILANQQRDEIYRQTGASLAAQYITTGPNNTLKFDPQYLPKALLAVQQGRLPATELTAIADSVQRQTKIGEAQGVNPDSATLAQLQNDADNLNMDVFKAAKATREGKISPDQYKNLLVQEKQMHEDPVLADKVKQIGPDDPTMKSGYDLAKQRLLGAAGGSAINGQTGQVNPAVQAKVDQFKIDTQRKLRTLLLSHQDISPYLDPADKHYVFSQDNIDAYRPTSQELATHLLAGPPKAVTPPAEKPSLSDVLRKAFTFEPKPAAPTPPDTRPGA